MKQVTRIKYIPHFTALKSPVLTNNVGEKFVVEIFPTFVLILKQGKRMFNIVDSVKHNDIAKAKRIARNLLINKYCVNLLLEVRQK